MRIGVSSYRELARGDLDEWRSLANIVYPPGEPRLGSDLVWAPLDPATDHLVRVWDENELRACAWVTQRTIAINGHSTRVAGVRGVLTHPDHRRRGFGKAAMERAHELIGSFGDCEFALLFSSVMAVPFYEKLDWRAVPGPVTCEQPGGRISYTERIPTAPVMGLMPSARDEPPAGAIDVRGLPW